MENDFLIGADPEFLCYTPSGRRLESSDVLEHEESDTEIASFGSDGSGIPFELRPAPSLDPLKVVSNIRDIFIRKVEKEPKYAKYKWYAGSFHGRHPLGGHVHLGITSRVFGDDDYYPLLYALNQYLACPSLLLDNKSKLKLRLSHGYCTFSNSRTKDYGIEYRTVGSWLTSPYIAA